MTGINRLADTGHKYDDIIDLSHHVSKTHPQMPVADRAAQFAPFAALTGHREAVEDTARRIEKSMDEDKSKCRKNI